MKWLRIFLSYLKPATRPRRPKAAQASNNSEQSLPPPAYSAMPSISEEEEEAVERLRCFLQLCLAQDYLIPTSDPYTTSLAGWGLKYSSWKSLPHHSHWAHKHRRLVVKQRDLELAINMQPDAEFATSITRPAEILGLDEWAVRRRIMSYSCHEQSLSTVELLVERGGWFDLVDKFLIDDAVTIGILFHGMTYQDKRSKTQKSLEEAIRKAHTELQDRYFDRLKSRRNWKISRDALNIREYHRAKEDEIWKETGNPTEMP
ncbi:MAG: hypothetical protein Q9187_001078 [Circinaria calcarea]